jgi:hypothetical protein
MQLVRWAWLGFALLGASGCPWITDAEQRARLAELDSGAPDGPDDAPPTPSLGTSSDADGDGVPDELDRCPAHPAPDPGDHDGDGVGDPCDVCPLHPDPEQQDSDEDGIGDECSVQRGNDHDGDGLGTPEERRHGTDIRDPDTDGDVLSDGAEVLLFGTDPLQADSDGGGADDRTELLWGCDPLDRGDDVGC